MAADFKFTDYKLMALVPADIVAAGTTSGGEGENGIEQAKPATKKRSGGEGEDQIEKAKPATKKRKVRIFNFTRPLVVYIGL